MFSRIFPQPLLLSLISGIAIPQSSAAWKKLSKSNQTVCIYLYFCRFVNLLGFDFKKFTPALSLGIITNKLKSEGATTPMPADQLQLLVSPYDLKRLEQYASNMADYHLIMDLVPNLAKIYFLYDVENLNKPNLGAIQQAILTGIGLQCKTVDTLRYSQS